MISNPILNSVSPSSSSNEIRLQCNKCFEYVMAQPSKQLDHVNIRYIFLFIKNFKYIYIF